MSRRLHAVLIAVAALSWACGGQEKRATGPRLSLDLPSDDGSRMRAESYRGKVLIIHVFATWSMPAKEDAIRLVDAFASDERAAIVGVAIDREAPTLIGAWRRGMEVTYPLALGDDAVRSGDSALGDTSAVPFTLIVDRDGRLLHRIPTPLGSTGVDEIRRRASLAKR